MIAAIALLSTIASCAIGNRPALTTQTPRPASTPRARVEGSAPQSGGTAQGSARGVPQRIAIDVTDNGFEPNNVTIAADRPVTLSFRLATTKVCRRYVAIRLSDQIVLTQRLVLHEAVLMTVTFPQPGTMSLSCDGKKRGGNITVE